MLSAVGAVYETRTMSFFSNVEEVFKTTVEPETVTEVIVTGFPSAVTTKLLRSAVVTFSASLNVRITALPDALTSERL